MPKTLGGKSTFQATSAHFVLCVYRRRVPSRRLANRPVRGALFLFYYIHCVSRPLAVQNTLQRRSLNDFFLEEQLCQLFERIPAGRQKTANLLVRVGQQSLDLFINDAGRLFAVLLVRLTTHWQENRLPLSFQSDQTQAVAHAKLSYHRA